MFCMQDSIENIGEKIYWSLESFLRVKGVIRS